MADAGALSTLLEDDVVHLEPLGEAHREPLRAACADDEAFWPLYSRSFGVGHFDPNFDAITATPGQIPFALFAGGVLVGMSSYMNIDAASDVLEIGFTYLTKTARGTGLNARFKRLMIDHAAACGFRRIEFRVDGLNARSQAAVGKLGAVREGVLRRNKRVWTGRLRDTVVFALVLEDDPT